MRALPLSINAGKLWAFLVEEGWMRTPPLVYLDAPVSNLVQSSLEA